MDSTDFKKNKEEAGGCIHTKMQGDTFGLGSDSWFCIWFKCIDRIWWMEMDPHYNILKQWRENQCRRSIWAPKVGGVLGEPGATPWREQGVWRLGHGVQWCCTHHGFVNFCIAPPSSFCQITGEVHVQGFRSDDLLKQESPLSSLDLHVKYALVSFCTTLLCSL